VRGLYTLFGFGFIYAAFYAKQSMKAADIPQVNSYGKANGLKGLRHFSASEFGVSFPLLSPLLLQKLDALRDAWGDSVIISPAIGALVRSYPFGHSNYSSRHNVIKYGEGQAADIMPQITNGDGTKRGLDSFEMRMFFNMAKDVGFTGIGAYPDWLPFAGFHVDVRDDHVAGNPATWSGIKTAQGQKYFALERGFA
jgi:hypothetical protein